MKPAPFDYDVARDLDHAVSLFTAVDGEAKYISGGQTLGPMMSLRLTQPDHLIDIARLEALSACKDDETTVVLGSALRHSEIEDGKFPDPSGGLMPRAARSLAYRAVRNRGTIGGSVVYADPAAEWPNILSALNATVIIYGSNGTREVTIDEFLVGYLTTSLAPEEIVIGFRVPMLSQGARTGFYKLCRQPGEYAESLAITVKFGPGMAQCILGCVAPVPLMLRATSEIVARLHSWHTNAAPDIAAAVAQDLDDACVDADSLDRRKHASIVVRSIRDALT
jgi:carbon-monoxide dehydrogenase medium subunit